MSRNGLDELVVLKVAGCREDHVAAAEAARVVVDELLLIEASDGLGGAEDRFAEGMVFPEILREEFVDEDVGIVFVDLDFFENDAALALDFGRGEDGIENEVGENVERDGHVVSERFDVEADSLFSGESVEVAADGVHFAGDVQRGPGTRAFEDHVFHEVGDAVDFGGFAPGTGFDPDSHGDGAEMFHALGENNKAVRQYRTAKVTLICHGHSIDFDCRRSVCRRLSVRHLCSNTRISNLPGRSREAARDVEMLYAGPSRDRKLPIHPIRRQEQARWKPAKFIWPECGGAVRARWQAWGSRNGAESSWQRRSIANGLLMLRELRRSPKALRQKLDHEGWQVGRPRIVQVFTSVDGTERYLVQGQSDGLTVETVWMPEGDGGEAGDGSEADAPQSRILRLRPRRGLRSGGRRSAFQAR